MAKIKTVQEEVPVILDAAGQPVSSNPAMIVYPTDMWGMTTDTRGAIKYLAARVCGCPEKYLIVQATLKIALEHLRVRYEEDKARIESEFGAKMENQNATQEPKAE